MIVRRAARRPRRRLERHCRRAVRAGDGRPGARCRAFTPLAPGV